MMMKLMAAARYFEERYYREYCETMDEMKMHKMLYFAQKESFVQLGEPLFEEEFHGWRYGPVLHEIRHYYHKGLNGKTERFLHPDPMNESDYLKYMAVLDQVFRTYSSTSSWTLSLFTHNECSWINSRFGLNEADHGDRIMKKSDILRDALMERVQRRKRSRYEQA